MNIIMAVLLMQVPTTNKITSQYEHHYGWFVNVGAYDNEQYNTSV